MTGIVYCYCSVKIAQTCLCRTLAPCGARTVEEKGQSGRYIERNKNYSFLSVFKQLKESLSGEQRYLTFVQPPHFCIWEVERALKGVYPTLTLFRALPIPVCSITRLSTQIMKKFKHLKNGYDFLRF